MSATRPRWVTSARVQRNRNLCDKGYSSLKMVAGAWGRITSTADSSCTKTDT